MNYFVGIDNGSSGTIGVLGTDVGETYTYFFPVPVKVEQDYTKKDENISRIDVQKLLEELGPYTSRGVVRAMIERPFMTPVRQVTGLISRLKVIDIFDHDANIEFARTDLGKLRDEKIVTADVNFLKTSLNAHRSFEAVLIALELLGIGRITVDSKAWQKMFLPGVKTSKDLKAASKTIGRSRWPMFETLINKHGDADGLFIAEYCRLYYQGDK